jgi:uncharacterized membrane protein YkoI
MLSRKTTSLPLAIGIALSLLAAPVQAQGLGLGLDLGGLGSVDLGVGGGNGIDLDVDLGEDDLLDLELGGDGDSGLDLDLNLDADLSNPSLVLTQEAALTAVRRGRALPLDEIMLRASLIIEGEIIDAQLMEVRNVLLYELKVLGKSGKVSDVYFYARSGLPVE